MEGLALKVGDQWVKLSAGTSITITEKSPVFDDGNSFSIPFQINAEMNRHLLGNADEVEGASFYEAIDRKPATLYVQGIPLFYGVIRLDSEEAALENGCIEVNLESGNLSFDDRIDGMSCRDVPVKDKLKIGSVMEDAYLYPYIQGNAFLGYDEGCRIHIHLPQAFQKMTTSFNLEAGVSSEDTVNVSVPYPAAKFCNLRICYKVPDEKIDLKYKYSSDGTDIQDVVQKALRGNYVTLDENRKRSSPCFYVLYFLDCLFEHLGISFVNRLTEMEDMCRLAFVNMGYHYDKELVADSHDIAGNKYNNTESLRSMAEPFFYELNTKVGSTYIAYKLLAPVYNCIANSKNFPDKEVRDVIKALQSGFGVRFIPNRNGTEIEAVYIKDLLADNESVVIPARVYSVEKTDINTKGFVLAYDGSDDDTSYNYTDYSNVVLSDSYSSILNKVDAWNKTLYIDQRNGNAYRIKIDEEATSLANMNPVLFEVGEFNKVEYGDCSDEENVERVDINFTPVVMNDLGYLNDIQVRDSHREANPTDTSKPRTRGESSNRPIRADGDNKGQCFAFYLDVSMMYPSIPDWVEWYDNIVLPNRSWAKVGIKFTYLDMQRFDEKFDQTVVSIARKDGAVYRRDGKSLLFENESPINAYDCGLTLGIMRGAGNSAGVEDYEENYDDEGNQKYIQVSSNAAFHSDICDNYNRLFDYNGTEQGGVDVSGRFSLKLRAEKPNPEGGFFPITDVNMQKRGLFDKFYSEYAYFVTHRKPVKMSLPMEIADFLRIDWKKRCTIGRCTGFVNKREYTVTDEGIGMVKLEIYVV